MIDHSEFSAYVVIGYFIGGSTNVAMRGMFGLPDEKFSFDNYIKNDSGIWEI